MGNFGLKIQTVKILSLENSILKFLVPIPISCIVSIYTDYFPRFFFWLKEAQYHHQSFSVLVLIMENVNLRPIPGL